MHSHEKRAIQRALDPIFNQHIKRGHPFTAYRVLELVQKRAKRSYHPETFIEALKYAAKCIESYPLYPL